MPVAVDEAGLRVDELERADVDALVLTPAHQHPTGAVLAGERRPALLAWLRARDAIVIEDDYDAEYRYDRAAVGALQGLEPDRIVYAGSASKTLAPALRLGWLVVPPRLARRRRRREGPGRLRDGPDRQHAFADFLARGELDRHLRRMRAAVPPAARPARRGAGEALPEATVRGIAAGLHATVELPGDYDEQAILAEARARQHRPHHDGRVLDRARQRAADAPASATASYPSRRSPPAVRELADAVRAAAPAS